MQDVVMGILALFSYFLLIFSYLVVRPKNVISVMDMFVVMLSIQFGPHAIIPHPFLEAALLVPGTYSAYAAGLAIAYFGLAAGLALTGLTFSTHRLRLFPPPERDMTIRSVRVLIIFTIIYLVFFIAVQGFDLSRTISYLNFFRGDTTYTYTELRREMYEDEAVLGISAVTRQSITAVIYAALIYASINFRSYRFVLIALSAILFIICCLQMNKFPILYYAVITGLVISFNKGYKSGNFISAALFVRIILALIAFALVLYGLYTIQYSSYDVQTDRLIFRVITRPFTANHDALYLWFAHIPSDIDFIGVSNIKPLATLFGLKYHSLMVEIPAIYSTVTTTYQAGFIGSSYGSFGYPGVFFGGLIVGSLVGLFTLQQSKLRKRWHLVVFSSVVGMNFYFLDSRELHTSLLSGGIAAVPIIFALLSLVRSPRVHTRLLP